MVLLLTGAIDIGGLNIPSTTIVDINERLLQYINCIDYAITHYKSISKIVFCENTNFTYDYSSQKELAYNNGKKIEIISFKGDYDSIIQKGKGFGEGEIIKYALNNSEIIRQCDGFYKLTGRLIVKNMDKIVSTTPLKSSFIYYPKTIYKIPVDHIETYFYKVDKNLYIKYLANAHQEVDEPKFRYLEHVFHKRLSTLWLRSFKTCPLISGLSGTSGNSYEYGTKNMLLENINYFIGVHNLKKTTSERAMTLILSYLLKIGRLFK
jgi:hypothetical protein